MSKKRGWGGGKAKIEWILVGVIILIKYYGVISKLRMEMRWRRRDSALLSAGTRRGPAAAIRVGGWMRRGLASLPPRRSRSGRRRWRSRPPRHWWRCERLLPVGRPNRGTEKLDPPRPPPPCDCCLQHQAWGRG